MKFELHINPDFEEALCANVHSRSDFTEQLEQLVMAYNGTDSITAYADGEMKVIGFNEVACVTVLDGKSFVIDTHGRRYKIRYKLYEVAKLLPSSFIKINKSTIANQKQIECFKAAFSGSVNVVFKSGYTDYVSRRCFAEIKKELRK
ncbi:transcriptional regulator, LytTR family [Ruminococcaceae bacterium P7]|nr:transcriptional regulator, LytTR family [Ruminococcaceae bacterium P7]